MKMKTWNVKYLNFNNEIRFKEILAGENSTKNEIIGLTLDNEIRYSTDCMKEVLEVSWLSIKTEVFYLHNEHRKQLHHRHLR